MFIRHAKGWINTAFIAQVLLQGDAWHANLNDGSSVELTRDTDFKMCNPDDWSVEIVPACDDYRVIFFVDQNGTLQQIVAKIIAWKIPADPKIGPIAVYSEATVWDRAADWRPVLVAQKHADYWIDEFGNSFASLKDIEKGALRRLQQLA